MEQVKRKSAEFINALTKEDFQHWYALWEKLMEQYVAKGGKNIEEEHSLFHKQ